jgi:hypothetical protein
MLGAFAFAQSFEIPGIANSGNAFTIPTVSRTHRYSLADQTGNILRIVFAIRVVRYAAALVGGDLILIDDPFEGGAIAEAVFISFGRDAAKREELVVDERSLSLLSFILVTQ